MKYALVNGHLLDGTLNANGEMEPHDGWAVLVDDERIVAVGDLATSDLMGYKLVDLKGAWVMPGLINLHAHLAASGKPPKANARPVDYKKLFNTLSKIPPVLAVYRKQCADLAKDQLLSGVTTLRTVGGILDFDGIIRDRVNEGKALGPRMLVCNTGVSVPGGHFAGSLATEASSPEEAAEHVRQIAETYIRRRAIRHLEKGRITIFAAGTGNPYFTTDTAAALRACEIGADVLLKATKVDGIYDSDPVKNPDAVKFDTITYMDVLTRELKVMDATATALCHDNHMPMIVFNLGEKDAFRRALQGENVGTTVVDEEM